MTGHCGARGPAKKETTTNNPSKDSSKSKKEIKTIRINHQMKMSNNNRLGAKSTGMAKPRVCKRSRNS
jgi:hypothetical protein